MQKKRVISGIQTSGDIHLGNYLGAIKRWVAMQDEYECLFFLADLHAITVDIVPNDLRKSTIESAAALFACGLDPDKSIIFLQSHIAAHTELNWILNCVTPIGWLSRMTQFKDKSGKDKEKASSGLYSYPILQAADVLLYHADLVPVGEDQKQHIELMRDIAGAVNRKCGKELLTLPEPLIPTDVARVKSLRDGTKKMSKSEPSDQSRINLSDDKDTIYQKLKRAKTDSIAEVTYEPEARPEVANLLSIYSAFSGKTVSNIADEYTALGFAKFKEDLAELVSSKMASITGRYSEFLQDPVTLHAMLKKGSKKAEVIAAETIKAVKEEFGFWG